MRCLGDAATNLSLGRMLFMTVLAVDEVVVFAVHRSCVAFVDLLQRTAMAMQRYGAMLYIALCQMCCNILFRELLL